MDAGEPNLALRPDEAEWGRDLPFPPEYEPLDVLPMVVFVRFVFDCEGPAEGQTKFRCLLRSVSSVYQAFDPLTAWPVPKRQPKAGGEESQAINHGSEWGAICARPFISVDQHYM